MKSTYTTSKYIICTFKSSYIKEYSLIERVVHGDTLITHYPLTHFHIHPNHVSLWTLLEDKCNLRENKVQVRGYK